MLSQPQLNDSEGYTTLISSEELLRNILHGEEADDNQVVTERRAKIIDIKARLAAGAYHVSSESLARAMLAWGEK